MSNPPYIITPKILVLVSNIAELAGAINATQLYKPSTQLRKRNQIKTIQATLEIEGNTMSVEQITALLENKRVVAPQKDITEVKNAIAVYNKLKEFNPYKLQDFLKAHKILLYGLINDAGRLRTTNVGIIKGSKIAHVAPSGQMVKGLMSDLFNYLNKHNELMLIKSCVFHYELEFIHPFTDGNGRMGRLWQTVLLMQQYPLFEYLPVETLIKKEQKKYYEALATADKMGQSTPFIEFMLGIILQALQDLFRTQNPTQSSAKRMELFKEKVGANLFTRKDYLTFFSTISAPTASRDLKWALQQGLLSSVGSNNKTSYVFV